MNVEIGIEAAQFPEKEFINGIFVAVHRDKKRISDGKGKRETDPGALLCAAPVEVGPRELGDHLVSPGNRTIKNAISQCQNLISNRKNAGCRSRLH
jgi:hypothetical protein